MGVVKYPCVYMRGGTSKAVFFHKRDLPGDRERWRELFLKVMGSPDAKQIDGMGGTVSSTSKAAVICPSQRPGADVDYEFFQVDINIPNVDATINCGNISSAVGPFAIDEGLVEAREPVTVVRVFNVNTQKIIEEHVRVQGGRAMVCGDAAIKGVPGTGSPIRLLFRDPCGAVTGRTFPTGNKKDVFQVPDFGPVEGTFIDCANPVVLVRAWDLGLTGRELTELEADRATMERLECIRGMAAQGMGLVEDWREARTASTSAPKIAFAARPQDYRDLDGNLVRAEEISLCCRAISVGRVHRAYPMTLAVATASAARIAGTVIHELIQPPPDQTAFTLGHASGATQVEVRMDGERVETAGLVRTARRIMDGFVYVRE